MKSSVLPSSETANELQNIEKSLLELAQASHYDSSNVRNSFLSVASGRGASDTYETSNSSVTSGSSTTNHSNRLNSTASNCSGDSAAGISLNTIDRETLEPLQEKKESVGDYESLRPLSRASVGQQG